jgi:hypothetical protein
MNIYRLENLAGPQHEPEEEEIIVNSEQSPDLSTTDNNESEIQTSEQRISSNEMTESSVQRKVSAKPNYKAPDIGQKLVRHKSKARINLQVPEITDEQNIKSEPLDLPADRKRG